MGKFTHPEKYFDLELFRIPHQERIPALGRTFPAGQVR